MKESAAVFGMVVASGSALAAAFYAETGDPPALGFAVLLGLLAIGIWLQGQR